ncbi:MAG: hypothetical protein PHQ46_02860 [Negativicutes bacterium]|nr:hypothetical protein [Negativicutes bacterium]
MNAKYCRHCGNLLQNKFNDTQPIPIVSESMLITSNQSKKAYKNYQNVWSRQIRRLSIKKYAVAFYLASIITTIGLIYVLATFKSVDEYQLLTGAWGFLLVMYFWRSAQ